MKVLCFFVVLCNGLMLQWQIHKHINLTPFSHGDDEAIKVQVVHCLCRFSWEISVLLCVLLRFVVVVFEGSAQPTTQHQTSQHNAAKN